MNRRDKVVVAVLLVGAFGFPGCRDLFGGRGNGGGEPRVLWRVGSAASSNSTPHDPTANADQSMIYFVTTDYRLKKVRAADGVVVWDVDAGPTAATAPSWNVVLSGGHAVVEKVDLFAFDTVTGQRRWSFVAPGGDQTGYSAIVANDSTVFAGSLRGRMYAIDSRVGTSRWTVDLTGGRTDVIALFPVLAGETVYVCTNATATPFGGTLWALDARGGAVRWSYTFTPELPQQYATCYGDPAIWNDLVIQPQSDGRVFAFDADDGAVRWTAPRVHQLPTQSGPGGTWVGSWTDERWAEAFGDHLVVTGKSGRGMVVAYDPATGAERWRNEEIAGVHLSHPAMDAGALYLGYGSLYAAFDLQTGRLRWRTPRSDTDAPTMLQGKPVVGADRIFVAGRDGSYALRK